MTAKRRKKNPPRRAHATRLSKIVLALASVVIAGRFLVFAAEVLAEMSCQLPGGSTAPSLFDDAMISLRYAHNLAHGDGLVFNPGERVEGYTNFLWVMVMVPFTAFLSKADAVLGVQLLDVGLVLLCAALSGRLTFALTATSRHATADWERYLLSATVGAFVLGYFPVVKWGLVGMEVPLLSCLLVGATLAAIKKPTRSSLLLQSSLLGAAYLTRPDAVVPAMILIGFSASRLLPGLRRNGERSLRNLFGFLLGPLALMALSHMAFRYLYYGEVVPNTYVMKVTGIPLALRLETGWNFTKPLFEQVWLLLGLAVAAVALAPKIRWVLLAQTTAMILYQIHIGGDGWYEWRFVAPTLPFLIILATLGARDICREILRLLPALAGLSGTVGCLVCLRALSIANAPFQEDIDSRMAGTAWYHCNQVVTANFLSSALHPSATIAVTWAGALPYYTEFYTHDLLGKTDPYIAATPPHVQRGLTGVPFDGMPYRPGHIKYDLTYSLVRNSPDYTERLSWADQDVSKEVSYHGTFAGYFRRDSELVNWQFLRPRVAHDRPGSPSDILGASDSNGEPIPQLMGTTLEPFEKVLISSRTWLSPRIKPKGWVGLEFLLSPSETARVVTVHTGHSNGFDIPRQVQFEVRGEGKWLVVSRKSGAPVISTRVPPGIEHLKVALRPGYRGYVAVRGVRIE